MYLVREYGDRALLLECGSGDEVLALSAALRTAEIPDVIDIVPGARTVLVALADPGRQVAVRSLLAGIHIPEQSGHTAPAQADIVIDVVYDGADLREVAALTGLSAGEVIEWDSAVSHRVSPIWSVAIPGCRYRAGPSREPGFRPDRSVWPASSAVSIRVSLRAAGNSSVAPTRHCGIPDGPSPLC